jgi:hypothetical protein
MAVLLTERIVEQAAEYYQGHLVICEEVSDCIPVDSVAAIEGAITEMFYSPYFTKKRNAKLVRRLHDELWPDEVIPSTGKGRLSIQTDRLYDRVRRELAGQLQDLINMSSPEAYEIQQKKREDLARELSAHPDRALAVA